MASQSFQVSVQVTTSYSFDNDVVNANDCNSDFVVDDDDEASSSRILLNDVSFHDVILKIPTLSRYTSTYQLH